MINKEVYIKLTEDGPITTVESNNDAYLVGDKVAISDDGNWALTSMHARNCSGDSLIVLRRGNAGWELHRIIAVRTTEACAEYAAATNLAIGPGNNPAIAYVVTNQRTNVSTLISCSACDFREDSYVLPGEVPPAVGNNNLVIRANNDIRCLIIKDGEIGYIQLPHGPMRPANVTYKTLSSYTPGDRYILHKHFDRSADVKFKVWYDGDEDPLFSNGRLSSDLLALATVKDCVDDMGVKICYMVRDNTSGVFKPRHEYKEPWADENEILNIVIDASANCGTIITGISIEAPGLDGVCKAFIWNPPL